MPRALPQNSQFDRRYEANAGFAAKSLAERGVILCNVSGKNTVKDRGYPLVYIEWEDSYGCSPAWENLENCSPAPMVCRSIGWLIHDDKKCKVVVPHLTQADHPNSNLQGCGDMTIPTSAIRKIEDVTIVNRKRR